MIISNEEELKNLRQSGKILHKVIQGVATASMPGVNLLELDKLALRLTESMDALCCFNGFEGYPDNICLSVNDEVVHGIPRDYVLREGDILGIDMGVSYCGMITDSAVTIGIGKVSEDSQRFMDVTKEAMKKAIQNITALGRVGDVGAVVQSVVEKNGYSIIQELTGHGVGKKLHENPHIPNFGTAGTGQRFHEGEVIAIEPIISMGQRHIYVDSDNWTIKTQDGSLGSQFEHTVILWNDHAEIIT